MLTGDHLSLITDHLNLEKSKIPNRDLCGRGHVKSVEELRRYKGQTKDNTKDLGSPHLLCNGPDNTYRQQMENGLSNKP